MRVQIPKARTPALPTASTFSTPSRPFQVDAQPAQGIVPSSESRLRIGELPPADHPAPGPIRRPALQSTRLPAARAVQARIPAFHGGVSAVIQRIGDDEGKALVEEARLGMEDGPGNLEESSQEARQRFLRAHRLLCWLNEHRDTSRAILDALCRVHGIANPGDKSVKEYINQDASDEEAGEIAKARKSLEDEARSLKGLADLVLFDFAREKTGGGSCDHCSAHMFFSLAQSHPDANISVERYMPVSNDEYEITPP